MRLLVNLFMGKYCPYIDLVDVASPFCRKKDDQASGQFPKQRRISVSCLNIPPLQIAANDQAGFKGGSVTYGCFLN
jgi:hypothetical protein